MSLIDDATHLEMIRAVGGVSVRASYGSFLAVFDSVARVDQFEDQEMVVRGPLLTARSCDVEGLRADDELVIDSATYRISHLMPDGTGMTTIVLHDA